MAKKDYSTVILIVVGLVLASYLNVAGIGDMMCNSLNICIQQSTGGGGGGGGTGGGGGSDVCLAEGTSVTMTIGPMKEKWNPSTDVTDRGARVFVNGVDRGVKADSATMTVDVGDDIVTFYGENETEGSASYYTNRDSFEVPCTTAFSTGDQGEGEKLYGVESATNKLNFKVFNEDDGDLNTNSATEDVSSGQAYTMDMSLYPSFEDSWSPNCPGIVVLEGNSTAWDELSIVGWDDASVPSQHSLFATTNEAWAYEVPAFEKPSDGAYKKVEELLYVDAASVTLGATNTFDLNVTFYDCDWYRDSNSGEMKKGVETDQNGDVGTTNFHWPVYFT